MEFTGIIEKGNGAGTRLGFPTANIPLTDASLSGIYAGVVTIDDKQYQAAIYADQRRMLLESHLLDFSGDLYGKGIRVELQKKLREDKAFNTVESLVQQIAADIASTKKYFSETKS